MATRLFALGTQCDLCFLHFSSLSSRNALPKTIEIFFLIFFSPFLFKCHHYHFNISLCRFICNSFAFWARYKWDGWSNNPLDFWCSQSISLFPIFLSNPYFCSTYKNHYMISLMSTCLVCSNPLKTTYRVDVVRISLFHTRDIAHPFMLASFYVLTRTGGETLPRLLSEC